MTWTILFYMCILFKKFRRVSRATLIDQGKIDQGLTDTLFLYISVFRKMKLKSGLYTSIKQCLYGYTPAMNYGPISSRLKNTVPQRARTRTRRAMRRADVTAGRPSFRVRGTDYPRRNLSRVPAGRFKVDDGWADLRVGAHVRDDTDGRRARIDVIGVIDSWHSPISDGFFLFRCGRACRWGSARSTKKYRRGRSSSSIHRLVN